MATFPPRRELMLANIQRILPQVDRLFIVLNEYDEVPSELADHPKIEAVIPPMDTKDVGKFYWQVDDSDTVFTVDDDLIFPDDYVEKCLAFKAKLRDDKDIFSALGIVFADKTRPDIETKLYYFGGKRGRPLGMSVLGTGLLVQSGKTYPSFEDMQGGEGFVDIRFANYQISRGRSLWLMPKTRGWIRSNLTEELVATSLYERYGKDPHEPYRQEIMALKQRNVDNLGLTYRDYMTKLRAGEFDR